MRRSLVLLIFVFACSPLQAETGLAQLQSFARDLDSFSARFEQVIYDQNGRPGETSRGHFSLMRPNFFRWDYQGDFPQQIIGDGKRIWIYDIELEQVSVKPQAESLAESPALLMLEPDLLERWYRVTEMGEDGGLRLLALQPLDEGQTFQRLLLGFRQGQPELLVLEDNFGQRTEIRFSEPRINPQLEPALFRFKPPAGVDVIGEIDTP